MSAQPASFPRARRYPWGTCENCGRGYPSNSMPVHRRACLGLEAAPKRLPQGHRRCVVEGCEMFVSQIAERCFRHSDKDEVEFARLDAALAMRKEGGRWA